MDRLGEKDGVEIDRWMYWLECKKGIRMRVL